MHGHVRRFQSLYYLWLEKRPVVRSKNTCRSIFDRKNRTFGSLFGREWNQCFDCGIGPCSIAKPSFVQCLVAQSPGSPYGWLAGPGGVGIIEKNCLVPVVDLITELVMIGY